MKPEQQRIAIAEWCGWTFVKDNPLKGWRKGHLEFTKPWQYALAENIPDYLNDLNAMWSAEEKLDPNQVATFLNFLTLPMEWDNERGIRWFGCHATAAQRAEALLRTLNLWQE